MPKYFKSVLIIFAVIYFLILTLGKAPASIVASSLHGAVPQLWLTGVSGTAWKGVANGGQVDLPGNSIPLGKVSWKIKPLTLLLLNPCITFNTNGVPGQIIEGEVCRSLGGASKLKDLVFETSADNIDALFNAQASGLVSVQVIQAELSGIEVKKADVRVGWQNARVKQDGAWFDLGFVTALIRENNQGGIIADIADNDVNGPYGLDLQGQWNQSDSSWSIAGLIEPRDNASRNVVSILQSIGEDTGDGKYRIEF